MLVRTTGCAALTVVLLVQVGPAAAEQRRTSDPTGVSLTQSGPDRATGTIRTTTTTGGSSGSGSTPSYSRPSRPTGSSGSSGGGEQQRTSDQRSGNQTGGGGGTTAENVQLLTNFIPFGSAPAAAPVPAVPPVVIAREAAASLQLPVQTVRIGPDPSLNRWNMLAVGYPLWLWREGAGTISESVALGGASLSMTATYQSTTYAMGDGNTVTCAESTPWVAGAQPAGTPSPTCGYSYTRPGTYAITATHTWNLSWSGLGESGSFPLTNVSSTTVEIGELASVVVGR